MGVTFLKIPIAFAELHNPLFLSGKNHKQKLYSSDMRLVFDTDADKLFVCYNDQIAIIPSTNVSSLTPKNPEIFMSMFADIKISKSKRTHINHSAKLDMRHAQVSDPSTTIQNPGLK